MSATVASAAGWIALALLSLIFLANALGVIDQRTAIHELAATGLPDRLARLSVLSGRVLQLVAVPLLFIEQTRTYAAIALILFLIPATLVAHSFWKAEPSRRDAQLAGFLKNTAMIGGLIFATTWGMHT